MVANSPEGLGETGLELRLWPRSSTNTSLPEFFEAGLGSKVNLVVGLRSPIGPKDRFEGILFYVDGQSQAAVSARVVSVEHVTFATFPDGVAAKSWSSSVLGAIDEIPLIDDFRRVRPLVLPRKGLLEKVLEEQLRMRFPSGEIVFTSEMIPGGLEDDFLQLDLETVLRSIKSVLRVDGTDRCGDKTFLKCRTENRIPAHSPLRGSHYDSKVRDECLMVFRSEAPIVSLGVSDVSAIMSTRGDPYEMLPAGLPFFEFQDAVIQSMRAFDGLDTIDPQAINAPRHKLVSRPRIEPPSIS